MGGAPRYPNQQLRSVSFETYFPGRLGAFSAMGELHEEVRAKFPNLFVPNLLPGEAHALRPYQLRNAEHSRSLALAVNQITYIAFNYPGHEAFIEEAAPLIGKCLSAYRVETLSRVTMRYENEIGAGRNEDGVPNALHNAFPGLTPKVFEGRACRVMDANVETPWKDDTAKGSEGYRVQVQASPFGDILRVQIHATVEDAPVSKLKEAAGVTHAKAVALFESVISESFRTFLSEEREKDERASG